MGTGIKKLDAFGDSKLVIEQMKGNWQCKAKNLPGFKAIAKELADQFEEVSYHHVERNLNKIADNLSRTGVKLYKQNMEEIEKRENEGKTLKENEEVNKK